MEWCTYNYIYYSKEAHAYLLYSSLSNMLVELNEKAYNDIIRIKNDPNSFQSEDECNYPFLSKGLFLVNSNNTEKNKIIAQVLQQRYNPYTLSLTIAPTRECNFACPYCYENNRIKKTMTYETQQSVIDFIKQFHSLKNLNVIWYGGEPTLAIDTIKTLSSAFKTMPINYTSYMVTNGYNLDKLSANIEDLNLKGIQITLDGTQETHDATRHLKDGNGTFNKILQNIDIITNKYPIAIHIRMNISKNNQDQYGSLHRLLKERYGNKVSLYPAFVKQYNNCTNNISCFEDNFQKGSFIKSLYWNTQIYTHELYPKRINKGCMMQQQNSFLIGPEGELYKCWHDLGKKDEMIGNISKLDSIDTSVWANKMINNDMLFDKECTSCVLFPSCNGGCTDLKNKQEKTCPIAKDNLEDFLDIHYRIKNHMLTKKQ